MNRSHLNNFSQFFIAAALLLTALFFQITVGDILNIRLGFILAALLAAAFFLNLEELILLVLFSAFVLNWQPGFSPEIIIFSIIPIAAYFIKTLVPLQPFLGNLGFIFIFTMLFYLIFSPRFLINRPGLLIADILASLVYGATAFWIMKTQS